MRSSQQIGNNYGKILIQLQKSLNSYLEAIQKLIEAVEKNDNLNEEHKLKAKKNVASTVTTLMEVQKIVHKKLNILIQHVLAVDVDFPIPWDESPEIIQFKSVKTEIVYNMNYYHYKKEIPYRTVIYRNNSVPSAPWKASNITAKKR